MCAIGSTNLCEPNEAGTRRCTEGKRGTGVSKKKPADSSRGRISIVGRRPSPAASGVGRDIFAELLKKEQSSD
jgi:hypothetical protein